MCETLQVQTSVAGYKVDKFQPAIEPRQLVPFVRSQQYVCSSLLEKTDAQCRGACSLLGKVQFIPGLSCPLFSSLLTLVHASGIKSFWTLRGGADSYIGCVGNEEDEPC
jgi:hypothetical protein